MFDGRWRTAVDRTTGPVGEALHRHGITADVLTATGLVSATATAVAGGHRSPPPRHHLPDPHGPARPPRRPGRQGRGDRLGPWRLLRLGHRPGGGRRPDVRLRLVSPRPWGGPPRASAHGHPGGDRLGLLRAGEGRVARSRGQGRPHGAGRADVPARRGLLERASSSCPCSGSCSSWSPSPPSPASSRSGTRRPAATVVIARRIEAWREGRVDSRWRAWREGRQGDGVPRRELARTSGAPVGRWRARRQEALSSRSGRTLRERRARRQESRPGRNARRAAGRRTPAGVLIPPSPPPRRPELRVTDAGSRPSRRSRQLARHGEVPDLPRTRRSHGPHARAAGAGRRARRGAGPWRCGAAPRSP